MSIVRRKQYQVQSTIFDNWEDYVHGILNDPQSVRKPYLRASYHVYKIGCLLVHGISLPVAQLCVIVIENILREYVGNSTRYLLLSLSESMCAISQFFVRRHKCCFLCARWRSKPEHGLLSHPTTHEQVLDHAALWVAYPVGRLLASGRRGVIQRKKLNNDTLLYFTHRECRLKWSKNPYASHVSVRFCFCRISDL